MAGYIRQSTFVDGDTITAALFNNEYNQLVNAFSNTSGHKHDGTTAEGPVIGLIGDAGETSPNNKVLIDTTNNYIEFYVEVSSAPVQQLYIADGAIIPVTDSDIDLGTTSLRFKDTYTDTVTTTGNVSIGGDLTVTGSATISGNLTFGDADTDSINLAAEIDSDIIPNTDGTYDLGSATKEWQDLYIDGTANIDSLIADTADINGGTIDGATIATSDITVGAGKTLDVSSGTLTLADNQISGDKVEGGTIAATTITDLTFGSLNDGTITVTAFVDEDNMVSNSATLVPTQQSVKAYVDAQVTAQDLDFQGDTGGALSIDLDSESLTIAGGTGIDTSGATNTLTVAIDSTVATLTGTQTLTNKTLTSPDVNTPDIDGGTVDGTVIGGATPAAGTFTTLTANTSITGTLATAAQPNITSVGTLTGLTTSGDINFGDNDKAIFGAGSDLQIYSDGTDGYIDNVTGDFYIRDTAGGTLHLQAKIGEEGIVINDDGGVDIYRNNALKLQTTSTGIDVTGNTESDTVTIGVSSVAGSEKLRVNGTVLTLGGSVSAPAIGILDTNTGVYAPSAGQLGWTVNGTQRLFLDNTGIDVTGTVTSDGLTVDGNIQFTDSGSTNRSILYLDGSDNVVLATGTTAGTRGIDLYTNNNKSLSVAESGDISFYEDTGTSQALYWDASAESLGIGTTSPSYPLHVRSAGTGTAFASNIVSRLESNGSGYSSTLQFSNNVDASATVGLVGTSLGFGIGTSEKMRIDSSGNVGIGTSSPDANLHISSAGGTELHLQEETAGAAAQIKFTNNNNVFEIGADANPQIFFINTTGNQGSGLCIDTSHNVGIGTDSPKGLFSVYTSAGAAAFTSEGISTAAAAGEDVSSIDFINRRSNANTIKANIKHITDGTANGSALTFGTTTGAGATERMRIDSSGNLLVGKSTSSFTTAGVELANGGTAGKVQIQRSSSPLTLVNLTDDGGIINFYKSTSAVGSIGVDASNNMFFESTASSHTGLTFPDNVIVPRKDGSNSDAGVDLGASGVRFKDLYLSGGAYLGGTGSANHLDDYEEGTWTPASGTTGVTFYGTPSGTYTKIGNLVYFTASFKCNKTGSGSTAVAISGLPFDGSGGICQFTRFEPTGIAYQWISGEIGSSSIFLRRPAGTSPGTSGGTNNNAGQVFEIDDLSTTTNTNLQNVSAYGWYSV